MITARENYLKVMRHQTPDWIPNVLKDVNFMTPMLEIERYDGMESGIDGFGVRWTYVEEACAPMPTPGVPPLITDITKWREQVRFPDLDAYDWETAGNGVLSVCDPDKLNYAMNINGMFERLHACSGMINALESLLIEPEACADFFNAVADHKIGMIRRIKKYFRAEVFNMHDDYGSNTAPFMSIQTWRNLLKQPLKRIVDACHAEGMIYQHHSCGFIEPFVDDLVDMGVDAIDCWQVCNTNMRAIKDKYQSRLTFVGGLDNQAILDNENAAPEDIYNEFKRATTLMAPGGSYIPFPITLTMNFVMPFFEFMEQEGNDFYKATRASSCS